MVSINPNASPASGTTNPKASKMARTRKATGDRHLKINGRDRRIRLPALCAERVSELNKKLGNRTSGQTIEWLLMQAEASVNAVLGNPALISPHSMVPRLGFETKAAPIPAAEPASKPKPMLPAFKYGSETDMEFSAEEIAKFLYPSSL